MSNKNGRRSGIKSNLNIFHCSQMFTEHLDFYSSIFFYRYSTVMKNVNLLCQPVVVFCRRLYTVEYRSQMGGECVRCTCSCSSWRMQKLIHFANINCDVLNLLKGKLCLDVDGVFVDVDVDVDACLDIHSVHTTHRMDCTEWILCFLWFVSRASLLLTLLLKVELIFNVT